MALAAVFVCLTGAGSCGSSMRRVAFLSHSGVPALLGKPGGGGLTLGLGGMESARRGTIGATGRYVAGGGGTMPYGEALTGRHLLSGDGATPGGRITVVCEAAGLHGGDNSPAPPLWPTDSLLYNLELAVNQTLSMLDEVQPPKGCCPTVLSSVERGLNELRVECKGLLEELITSERAAAITLVGLHCLFRIMLSFCSSGLEDDKGRRLFPDSLAALTKRKLIDSMSGTGECVNNFVNKKAAQEDVRGAADAAEAAKTFTELLETVAKETSLLAEVTEVKLSQDVTHSEVSSVLKNLSDRCHEVTSGGIPNHVAVRTLLGIHDRFRIVILCCKIDGGNVAEHLEASINASLVTSMARTKQCYDQYVEQETKYAARPEMDEEVE